MREAQSLVSKRKKDKKIMDRLTRFASFEKAREFFMYLSHRGEVSTDTLLEKFFKKKKIIVPKIQSKRICLFELQHPSKFQEGKFGIREPVFCILKRAWHEIDVAIVPGIAFDMSGHRIGFGGGYFDRFLKKLDCTTIGLAYEWQIIDKVPTHPYDVPVDFIITEKRIINCSARASCQ